MRLFLAIVALVLLFALIRSNTGFDFSLGSVDPALLGYAALFAAGIVASELLRPLLSRLGAAARFVVVAILAGLVWMAVERGDVTALLSQTIFHAETLDSDNIKPPAEVRLKPAWDGVFRTIAQVNSRSVGVLVAPSVPVVVLQYSEAERLDLHPETLDFNDRIAIADRKIEAAPFKITSIRMNGIELFDVKAAIAKKDALESNIFGLSFLNRLTDVLLEGGDLVLRQARLAE